MLRIRSVKIDQLQLKTSLTVNGSPAGTEGVGNDWGGA
jgi:hypothetical protein